MNKYLFKVKRAFKSTSGRECQAGDAVELRDRDEVRRLLSLGFILPGGPRNADREELPPEAKDTPRRGKWRAVQTSTIYTR
jgi:hypothetical protein